MTLKRRSNPPAASSSSEEVVDKIEDAKHEQPEEEEESEKEEEEEEEESEKEEEEEESEKEEKVEEEEEEEEEEESEKKVEENEEEVEKEETEEKEEEVQKEKETTNVIKPTNSTVTPSKRCPTVEKLTMMEKRRKKNNDRLPFQRVWSEHDEIVILEGMVDYMKKKKKKGLKPNDDMDAFLEFIKKSLQVDHVKTSQLREKIRRLKEKFQNNARKEKELGEKLKFLKPHDSKSYEISKMIWTPINVKALEASNNGGGKSSNRKSKAKQPDMHEPGKEDDLGWSILPSTLGGFLGNEEWLLELIGTSKAKELEQKWKLQIIDETKAYLNMVELAREGAKAVLDGLESTSNS
ncbi:Protein of unknown function DUF573 [Macleaya cordata]|uniref:Glabrous enhancer-binding protein-like DBD domain-containing protein n=1 Tax=Macleaya cordata TaxID=56857 RepID=A0A200QNL9_MACCD|nr:Protein of unknown function DUF573 [Macleaya cordata]